MDKSAIEVDDRAFLKAVDNLQAKNLRAALRSTLRSAAKVLNDDIYSSAIGVAKSHDNISRKDVVTKIWSRLGGFVVYLPVRRITRSHAVSLRWMMTGTTDRYTRGRFRAYRGQIQRGRYNFFTSAVQRSIGTATKMITDALSKNIDKQIKKANLGNQ